MLRQYQQEASDAVVRELEDNSSTLVVLPTGTGKTVLFADVVRRFQPRRCLVFAHREELVFQAKDKIEKFAGVHCEVEMGQFKSDGWFGARPPCVVSSVQTLASGGDGGGRMTKFDPSEFGSSSWTRRTTRPAAPTGRSWTTSRRAGARSSA